MPEGTFGSDAGREIEALCADLIAVVSDLPSPFYRQQRETVFDVLDQLGAGGLDDLAEAAQRFAAGKEIVDHEHTVTRVQPFLGDEQRDLFLVSIGKNLTLIQAAFDVVALGLFRINHGLAVPVRANRGKGNAAGLCGQNEIYVVEIKIFFEFICDASHKRTVDAVVEKAVDLDDVAGQDLAFAANAFLEQFHGTVLLSYNISARAVLPL